MKASTYCARSLYTSSKVDAITPTGKVSGVNATCTRIHRKLGQQRYGVLYTFPVLPSFLLLPCFLFVFARAFVIKNPAEKPASGRKAKSKMHKRKMGVEVVRIV